MADGRLWPFSEIGAVPTAARDDRPVGFHQVQAYLTRFGYLSPSEYTPGELDSATAVALWEYQQFNSLPITGLFDTSVRDQMTQPRCGLPDFEPNLQFVTVCRWERAELSYVLDTGTADVPGQMEWEAVRAAFRTWQALGILQFREVNLAEDPDIQIDWRPADDPDLSMEGGVLAHADYPPRCTAVTRELPKPVHFDDSEHTWAVQAQAGTFDIQTVALHEIGHIVGLAHSSDPDAVMRAYMIPGSIRRSLSADDISGFNALYAKVPFVQELSQAVAANRVRAARLMPRFTGVSGPGAWVRLQSPEAGTIVDPGSTVTMQLRRGPIP